MVALLIFLFLLTTCQAQNLRYAILKSDDTVGVFYFSRQVTANTILYKAETYAKAWLIFPVSVITKEESFFKDGVLQYSSIFRKVNGSIKANNHTGLIGNSYIIDDKKEREREEYKVYPITGSFLSLYYNEPVNTTAVYSDNYKKQITVSRRTDHQYKATMPDGNHNYYYYEDGVCNRVDIVHSFYKITFRLITKTIK